MVALILRLDVFPDIILNVTAPGKSIRAHKFVLSYSLGVLRCYLEESGMSIYYRHTWYVICNNVKQWSIISTRTLKRKNLNCINLNYSLLLENMELMARRGLWKDSTRSTRSYARQSARRTRTRSFARDRESIRRFYAAVGLVCYFLSIPF